MDGDWRRSGVGGLAGSGSVGVGAGAAVDLGRQVVGRTIFLKVLKGRGGGEGQQADDVEGVGRGGLA